MLSKTFMKIYTLFKLLVPHTIFKRKINPKMNMMINNKINLKILLAILFSEDKSLKLNILCCGE